jgi:hypothetical protein
LPQRELQPVAAIRRVPARATAGFLTGPLDSVDVVCTASCGADALAMLPGRRDP